MIIIVPGDVLAALGATYMTSAGTVLITNLTMTLLIYNDTVSFAHNSDGQVHFNQSDMKFKIIDEISQDITALQEITTGSRPFSPCQLRQISQKVYQPKIQYF